MYKRSIDYFEKILCTKLVVGAVVLLEAGGGAVVTELPFYTRARRRFVHRSVGLFARHIIYEVRSIY